MTWDWERLSTVLRRLKLPAEEYAVGTVGHGLSRDRASTADRVELLVTETGWRRLKERAWREAAGGSLLRHPKERSLTARLVLLDSVRHEVVEVDGIPVVGVEPDVPEERRQSWSERTATATSGVLLAIAIGAVVYGSVFFYPTTEPATIWQHLTFRTEKVEATVEGWNEGSTCTGLPTYDISPRIGVTLTWTDEGQTRSGYYTGCGASVDSPQDIWVTAEGEVASQSSPWVDHLWPAIVVGIVPYAFVVWPVVDRLRSRWWRRRTSRR
ncbi:hypothetical protein EXE58_08320 [Nocardioides seonyuensis]|uniref:Uncharacterized protein n=1 Tax=Nocardioides seonyuensis TaxID=2518371 RepID=A0A4P7IE40_9ACTN|nr:hypothetical protein [Nocardioides seonyuensis]QBX55456.1 hypothetical protein EXE58_08320 [Nocardioides seonyuensis]